MVKKNGNVGNGSVICVSVIWAALNFSSSIHGPVVAPTWRNLLGTMLHLPWRSLSSRQGLHLISRCPD